jgi:DNA-binding response OmpR family regulator
MPALYHILLIEDDHDDISFLKDALDENNVNYKLETLTKGDQIIPYLQQHQQPPDLIIMDLNLPKLHGREVLCKIRENKNFKTVPLIVLTTSSLPEDINFCRSNGADNFITKPSGPEGFNELIRTLLHIMTQSSQIGTKLR